MHFATFAKLLTQSTADKIRDLEAYAKPGGFDFYRPSREGVVNYAAHRRPKDAVAADIQNAASANNLEHNIAIFEKAAEWIDKQPGTPFIPNRGVWRSPQARFSVRVEPEIGLETKTHQDVVAIYPRREPRLNRDVGGACIILLQEGYRGAENVRFGILDAHGGKVCRTRTNVSEAFFRREVEVIDAELARILG